jgi:D-alanyl-D-alanine carboxypeptidase (penicillin-binding protein 5/6)
MAAAGWLALSMPAQALPTTTAPVSAPPPLELAAKSAILIDQATGRVLFERDSDNPLPPASLAKLMTLHLVYQKLQSHAIRLDDVVTLTAGAWEFNQAPGSSLMHLQPGQIVTVEELMKGMIVMSGNDAANALAQYVAGSRERFVSMMNEESRWMGFESMVFTDPSGVDPGNRVTAREFAEFCRLYIDLHPESLSQILSLREFEYPQPWNLPDAWPGPTKLSVTPIKTYNGNPLVWAGSDGLKTGHLDEENFTVAVTLKRGETRLIAVLLGIPGKTLNEGYRQRSIDAKALLDYGFRTYSTFSPDIAPLKPVRVWMGERTNVSVELTCPLRVTVRSDGTESVTYSVITPPSIVAPVKRGQILGRVAFYTGTEELASYDLQASEDVKEAGFLKRAWDAVVMGITSLFGG